MFPLYADLPDGSHIRTATLCGCGDLQALGNDGQFLPHTSRKTDEPCEFRFRDVPAGTTLVRSETKHAVLPDMALQGPEQLASALYVPPAGKPGIYLVDIDGTVALMGDRHPFDWPRVGEDKPNMLVVKVIQKLANHLGTSSNIVFMSGRPEQCRLATEIWLRGNVLWSWRDLFMRADGDYRPDEIVKRELFDKHIRDNYVVEGVFDDRNKVVKMWREDLGLCVFHVADFPEKKKADDAAR